MTRKKTEFHKAVDIAVKHLEDRKHFYIVNANLRGMYGLEGATAENAAAAVVEIEWSIQQLYDLLEVLEDLGEVSTLGLPLFAVREDAKAQG